MMPLGKLVRGSNKAGGTTPKIEGAAPQPVCGGAVARVRAVNADGQKFKMWMRQERVPAAAKAAGSGHASDASVSIALVMITVAATVIAGPPHVICELAPDNFHFPRPFFMAAGLHAPHRILPTYCDCPGPLAKNANFNAVLD